MHPVPVLAARGFVLRPNVASAQRPALRPHDASICSAQLPLQREAAAAPDAGLAATLDRFWLARGVTDPAQRRQLLAAAAADDDDGGAELTAAAAALPGLAATWGPLEGAAAGQVAALSRRIGALRALLGGKDDIDVVWMVVRRPELLTADLRDLARRLLGLRTSRAAEGLDVAKLAEAQPGLLLQDAAAGVGEGGEEEETPEEQQLAWEHGLTGDGGAAWAARLAELGAYAARHGDAHVGCRDGDDPDLARWAAKQRASAAAGALAAGRAAALAAAGFEFDAERAEWLRWFNQIAAFQAERGHCSPDPLSAGSDFLLLNWCAVQRIARRSRRLADDRAALLDAIGFDWTGADALS
jgi:hypothetical protein